MNRTVLHIVCGLVLLPASSWAFSFFSISSAQIWKLHAHTYRLQVTVDYGGEIDVPTPSENYAWVSDPFLCFTQFAINAPSTARNFFNAGEYEFWSDPYQTTGWWHSQGSYHQPGSLGRMFGFDFDYFSDLERPIALGYSAGLEWHQTFVSTTGEMGGESLGESSYSGRFIAQVVPEPTTLVLVGLGLAGIGIFRRRQ